MQNIQIETKREKEDDCYYWEARATRGNLVAFGGGYSEQKAIERAKSSLIIQEKNLSPTSPNWENTEIAFLASVTCYDVCVDYSPSMLELSQS